MEELEKLKIENKRLLAQVKDLEAKNQAIATELEYARRYQHEQLSTHNQLLAEYHDFKNEIEQGPSIDISSITFEKSLNPTMLIHGKRIEFESVNDKAAILAEALFRPSRLKKLAKGAISSEEIHGWLYSPTEWFSMGKSERNTFNTNLYQWVRRLNDKIAPQLRNYKFIEYQSNNYKINPDIIK